MRRSGLILACVTALALALTACTAPASPSASRTPTTTESSSPGQGTATPTPDAEAKPKPASVIISVDGIAIVGDDGAILSEFGYFDADAALAVAALSEAFGSQPELSREEARTHFAAADIMNWGGFEVVDLETETQFPELPNYFVRIGAEQSGGVAIATTDGVHVGMSSAEVAPLAYRSWIDIGTGVEQAMYRLEEQPVDGELHPDYEPAALSVGITASSPDGVVERIMAPLANWGS